jgi:hypothetical protein
MELEPKEPKMTFSNLSKALLVALGLGLVALPSVSVAQSRWNQELVNRPGWSGYGPLNNYDRLVNGSDASTPGHN